MTSIDEKVRNKILGFTSPNIVAQLDVANPEIFSPDTVIVKLMPAYDDRLTEILENPAAVPYWRAWDPYVQVSEDPEFQVGRRLEPEEMFEIIAKGHRLLIAPEKTLSQIAPHGPILLAENTVDALSCCTVLGKRTGAFYKGGCLLDRGINYISHAERKPSGETPPDYIMGNAAKNNVTYTFEQFGLHQREIGFMVKFAVGITNLRQDY